MEDKKKIKTIFSIDANTIISDTEDNTKGEASVGYQYDLNTSIPELAFSIAGFLKALDSEPDIKETFEGDGKVGLAFITLLQQYYSTAE